MDGESVTQRLLALENLSSSFLTDPSLFPPTSLLPHHQTQVPHCMINNKASSSSSSTKRTATMPSAANEGEEISAAVDGGRGKGGKMKKRGMPARIAFQTRSVDDVLDDGYRWRKYGQKSVKNNAHPRSYYRCTYHTCNVKKQIQRLANDHSIVVTTYDGVHNHPCEKWMQCLGPLLRQLDFLSRI